jgi:hypothetical protein
MIPPSDDLCRVCGVATQACACADLEAFLAEAVASPSRAELEALLDACTPDAAVLAALLAHDVALERQP